MTKRPIPGGASPNILCVITAIGCGGAERRLAWLVNRLSERGHRIALRVLNENGVFFDVDDRVGTRFFSDDHYRIFTAPARFWGRSGWLRRQVAEVNRYRLEPVAVDLRRVLLAIAVNPGSFKQTQHWNDIWFRPGRRNHTFHSLKDDLGSEIIPVPDGIEKREPSLISRMTEN